MEILYRLPYIMLFLLYKTIENLEVTFKIIVLFTIPTKDNYIM